MHPYFEVFGHTVPAYFLCAITGIICALGLAMIRRRSPQFNIQAENVFFAVLCAFIGALIGAKVFQLVGYIIRDGKIPGFWSFEHWKQILLGIGVFYGGLIGGSIAVLIYVRTCKLNLWEMSDILIPAVLLFNFFGRVGCYFAGCCYGVEDNLDIELFKLINAPNGVPLVPVQLFEAMFNLLILAAFLIIQPERKCKGILLPLYLILYSSGRFVLEFFRGDSGRGVYILSISQWISLLVFPIGILLLNQLIKNILKPSEKRRIS